MTDPFLDDETGLVDLTDVPLCQVMAMDESVLAHSLRRLAQEVDRQEDIVAGFEEGMM
jgi:FXSXX-COOH protein